MVVGNSCCICGIFSVGINYSFICYRVHTKSGLDGNDVDDLNDGYVWNLLIRYVRTSYHRQLSTSNYEITVSYWLMKFMQHFHSDKSPCY